MQKALIRVVVLSSVLTVAATAAASAKTAAKTTGGVGRIAVGVGEDPAELDPAGNVLNFTAASVSIAIYDALMTTPFGQAPRPALAQSLAESPDRKTWTLKVRPGVKFHDGNQLDAAAVKFNLDRQKTSQFNGETMALLKQITVVDAATVRITLDKPYVAMPYLLSGSAGIMLSPKVVVAKGSKLKRDPAGAGTGPYKFKEWVTADRIVVVRNPDYWGPIKPRLDEITFKVIPDESGRLAALRAGNIQSMVSGLPDVAEQAEKAGLSVVVPPLAGSSILLLNNSKPPFNDARMRRAAALAIDGKALQAIFRDPNYEKQGFGPWPQGNPWYTDPERAFAADPAAAKRLVEEYEKENGPVKVAYLTTAANGPIVDGARVIVKNWQDVGIDATVDVRDVNLLVLLVVTAAYDAAGFVIGLPADPDQTAWPIFHSTSFFNFSKYKNTEMDAALEAGRTAANDASRKAIYAKVQQLYRRDIPFIIGSPGTIRVLSDKKLCGVEPTGWFPAKTAGLAC